MSELRFGQYRAGDDDDPESCDECPKGYYQETKGQASCLPCLPGEFGNKTGLSQCHKCAIGTVSETSKSTNCTECNAGQSSDSKGSAKCTSCGAGQYSNVSGVECKDCAKGRYRVNEKDEDQNNPKDLRRLPARVLPGHGGPGLLPAVLARRVWQRDGPVAMPQVCYRHGERVIEIHQLHGV